MRFMTHPLREHPDLACAYELVVVFFTSDSPSEREEAQREALDRLAMVEGAND